MSHFATYVFTHAEPDESMLNELLDPFDENNEFSDQPKWDWWQIGGRFGGSLPGDLDSARVADLDYKELQEQAAKRAEEFYDSVMEKIAGIEPPKQCLTNTIGEHDDGWESRRDGYWEHPWVAGVKKAAAEVTGSSMVFFMTDPYEEMCVAAGGRSAFIEKARMRVGVPFSFVDLNGEWHEQGQMGWFGMASGERDQRDWGRQFHDYLSTCHDEVWVTCIDMHV